MFRLLLTLGLLFGGVSVCSSCSTCWAQPTTATNSSIATNSLPKTKPSTATKPPPNIVIIFVDDLGYADIAPFGYTPYKTPHLDAMAARGRKFTDFVTSSAVCSASRAALLTGCNHRRVGISGALFPRSDTGLNPDEMTFAELVKQQGYATACFGKWHLGHHKKFLPLQHGFDEYFGLPYSNDMWNFKPGYKNFPPDKQRSERFPPLPLLKGNEAINPDVQPEDQRQLTTQYTEHAVNFINRNAKQPFLLYVPHSMVHVPLYVSDKFKGKSGSGLFGDVMMEVDWSVGQINEALQKNGVADNTLVVFTSDNGPWLSYGSHAGSAAPLREGKGTMFEGGYRVCTVMQWPGKIEAGSQCDELCSTIDLLPTIAKLTDASLSENKIDGKDIRDLMFGKVGSETKSPHEFFPCYYSGGELQAVRDRRYKLVFPHKYRTIEGKQQYNDGRSSGYDHRMAKLALYDLKADVGETKDVASDHPEVVQRLTKFADQTRTDLGDKLQKIKGTGCRPVGKMKEAQ